MQENEVKSSPTIEDKVIELAEKKAEELVWDMEMNVLVTKRLLSTLIKCNTSPSVRSVTINLEEQGSSTFWSVSLFTDRVYADESYAPRSLKGALAVAECLLKGEEPPKNYASL